MKMIGARLARAESSWPPPPIAAQQGDVCRRATKSVAAGGEYTAMNRPDPLVASKHSVTGNEDQVAIRAEPPDGRIQSARPRTISASCRPPASGSRRTDGHDHSA